MPQKKTAKKTAKQVSKRTATKSTKKAAKKATKKSAPRAAGKSAAPRLVYASNNESFWVSDGQVLNSLPALRDAFTEMDIAVYRYHAEGGQNDFAVWVRQVLGDDACASALEKAKTPKGARTAVVKHLKHYQGA
ncbi:MAG: hypothetical protein ACOC4E_01460 [Patescibacteria group bacterium]